MIIRLNQVTKFYGGLKALDALTLDVRPGAIGLLGPNGAGKSTLIKVLLGLVRQSSGQATVLDHDARTDSRAIRQEVGYMPEDDCYIAGMSGVRAVSYAGELAGLPARTALRRAHEMLDYVTIAEERYREVQTYSTGMKQKIKLAQAIIHAPKIVFLDEPTSGLDPKGRERMLHLIRSLSQKKGVSVVVSTHILQDIEACCDAVIILGKGRLLVYDDLVNLRRSVEERTVVRLNGDRDQFLKAIGAKGRQAAPVGTDEVQIIGDGQLLSEQIFKSAQESGTVVRQIEPSRTSLEEIFLKAVTGDKDAHL